jgi:hypothetical protein
MYVTYKNNYCARDKNRSQNVDAFAEFGAPGYENAVSLTLPPQQLHKCIRHSSVPVECGHSNLKKYEPIHMGPQCTKRRLSRKCDSVAILANYEGRLPI